MEGVSSSIRSPTRKQEAGETLRRLSENQKSVTHRCGAKPFVTRNDVILARSTSIDRLGQRRICSYVAAALAFGHTHTEERTPFLRSRHRARIIGRRKDPWFPFAGEFRLQSKRRDRRECHG